MGDDDRSDTDSPVGPVVKDAQDDLHGYVNLPQDEDEMSEETSCKPPLLAKKERSRYVGKKWH